jgi:hypothetical protein
MCSCKKTTKETEDRFVFGLRACLVLMVLGIVMTFLIVYSVISEQQVYACSDTDKNPPDVQLHCKQLTKNQWWGAYYESKK